MLLIFSYGAKTMPINPTVLADIETGSFTKELLDLRPQSDEQVLDDNDLVLLSAALKKNKHIKKINLHHNSIGDKGAQAIAEVATLEELDLSNGLSGYFEHQNHLTQEGAKALSESKSPLTYLNLSGNDIGDGGFKSLSNKQSIIKLSVMDCSITAEGASYFFSKNSTVTDLSLEANEIGNEGLKGIDSNTSLTTLNIKACGITGAGAATIAQNHHLKIIFLGSNVIGDDGAKFLAAHSTVEQLDLNHCEIHDQGAQAFLGRTSYNANKKLKLTLFGNPISEKKLKLLLPAPNSSTLGSDDFFLNEGHSESASSSDTHEDFQPDLANPIESEEKDSPNSSLLSLLVDAGEAHHSNNEAYTPFLTHTKRGAAQEDTSDSPEIKKRPTQ